MCVGGGWWWCGLVGVSAWGVSGLVPGGARGGIVLGWHCLWRGRRGRVLCWVGLWAARRVVWVLRVRVVRFSWFLVGRGVEVGGVCLDLRVGLWSMGSGWLLVDGARWHGWRPGGLLVVVGCFL